MPVERLRMRPWLEGILNDDVYPGVEWINKGQKTFRLPWKHASRSCWQLNSDASLFRAWAEHTGKFNSKDIPNAKMWKANFRCALNSLPDMLELTERRSTKGNDAFKVYQIIDKVERKKTISRKGRRRRHHQRTQTVCKRVKPENEEEFVHQVCPSTLEILEPVEVSSDFPFSLPQPYPKQYNWDHDYATTRYFDLFTDASEKNIEQNFNHPESKIVKTEPQSPAESCCHEEFSLYIDENVSKKEKDVNKDIKDDKVMSDDEVVELIDELSSECDSLDTVMDDFPDSCMERIDEELAEPRQRSHSTPTCCDGDLEILPIFKDPLNEIPKPPAVSATRRTKSKSMSDIKSIITTTPQEFLQSCL